MEEWKRYNDYYEVSNYGRVRTIKTGKIKILCEGKGHYLYVNMKSGDMQKLERKSVHRLVAKLFIPNPENLREVDHKDCNKHNNCVSNLEWVSSSENKLRAIDNKLFENNKKHWFGDRKPVIAINLDTGEEKTFISLNQAERYFNSRHISDVLKGKRSQCKGHTFKYATGGDANGRLQ